ncbi:MAG: TatD family nuclease-associated radical SAM protein [Methanosarcinaceae archaeon]|nr:TatD family nuclease-associated radical SAM protein [Methanosarcinaceae archaeon]
MMKNTTKDTIYYEAYGNLYLNITNQCSANCVFCIRDFSDGVYGYNLRLSHEPTADEIINELDPLDLSKYKEVVFTGFGEPTIRLDELLEVTRWLTERNVLVRLDTNGHANLINPHRDAVSELKEAGLSAVSVSLNAESEELYNELCRPVYDNSYKAMLDFTKVALDAGMQTRMTVVGVPEIDIEKCERIAHEIGADFHVR